MSPPVFALFFPLRPLPPDHLSRENRRPSQIPCARFPGVYNQDITDGWWYGMKLFLDIQEKYTEPEIHICADRRSGEVLALRELLEGALCTRIAVHRDQEARSLAAYEIVRIYSQSKKVYVRTKADTYEVRDRLYALEETLGERGFVRISNSEIVNVSQIEGLDMSYAGTIKMTMKNGDTTFVSRRYVRRIKDVLG